MGQAENSKVVGTLVLVLEQAAALPNAFIKHGVIVSCKIVESCLVRCERQWF